VPIAAAACMGKDVVQDSIATLLLAIQDLIKYDKNIDLAFGFCNVRITHRNLSVMFRDTLSQTVGHAKFEESLMR